MAAITTVEGLEAAIATEIAALDASDYDQGSLTASWKESDIALTPEDDPNPSAHLAFAAWCESTDLEGQYGCVICRADVVVRFLFRLRAGSQNADMREASSAAADVMFALRDGYDSVGINVLDAGTKTIAGGGWAVVEVRAQAIFELVAA